MNQTKKSYSAPKLTTFGNVEVLTQASKTVLKKTDALFPTNTPVPDLRYS